MEPPPCLSNFSTASDRRERAERPRRFRRSGSEDSNEIIKKADRLGHSVGNYRRRRKTRRRGRRGRTVRISRNAGPGALATLDVVSSPITDVSPDPYRLLSANLGWSWGDIQAVADDGLEFGLAHSDYTAAEVEECLEAQAAIDPGDKVAREQANRWVRSIGRISSAGVLVGGAAQAWNNGLPKFIRLNWYMSIGDTLNVWIRNSSGTVWTTGSGLFVNGQITVTP